MSSTDFHSPVGPQEEAANMLTHAVGAILFLFGSLALIIRSWGHHDFGGIAAAIIYGGSLVLLYSTSSFYHATANPRRKGIFQIMDHCAIYILIAGTYTPFLLVSLRHHVHYTFLIVMWAIALAGVIYKLFFTNKLKGLSTLIYLGMGWMALFKINVFFIHLPAPALVWIVAGGLSYTAGTIFYSRDHIRYNHALWHLFVLCGSACHFIAIYYYVY